MNSVHCSELLSMDRGTRDMRKFTNLTVTDGYVVTCISSFPSLKKVRRPPHAQGYRNVTKIRVSVMDHGPKYTSRNYLLISS